MLTVGWLFAMFMAALVWLDVTDHCASLSVGHIVRLLVDKC